MKKRQLLLGAALLAGGPAGAKSSGYCAFIPYYGNKPYMLCTGAPISPWSG